MAKEHRQWDYRIADVTYTKDAIGDTMAALKKFGDEGWEAWHIILVSGKSTIFIKRPRFSGKRSRHRRTTDPQGYT